MKLNISFSSFKKNHKLNKDQLIYKVKGCEDYKQVENIFNFLLVEKIVLYLSLWKKVLPEDGIQ